MKVEVVNDIANVIWKKESFTVIHIDDYGVLVIGGDGEVAKARKLLVKLGYEEEEVRSWSYRPHMQNQIERAPGEFGSPYGGDPAVAFYFSV